MKPHDLPGTLAFEDTVRHVIGKRVGASDFTLNTELTVLGIDSLMLLRVIADFPIDPSLEIDPVGLADVVTVADLQNFLSTLTTKVEQ